MKRRASRELIFDRVARLRKHMPNFVLSADVLVGFPTETQDQFAQTLEAIESLKIAYPHVFPYSNRDGAPAARIPKQIAGDEKKRRARLVRELGQRVWAEQALSRVSSTQRTIIESNSDASAVVARCDDYFPVKLTASPDLAKGQWCTVKISGIDGQSLLGENLACD